MKLSVILCTHNPRRDYLARTLDALRAQTLPQGDWELLIVDNNSSPPLSDWLDLAGLPARCLRESNQGFTPALLTGLEHVSADLCLLLHDDNVLPSDYLIANVSIAAEWPQLGAWGGGYEPEFEEPPAAGLESLLTYLAIHPILKDRWSNALYDYGATPCGAGMAVRTSVLRAWARLTREDTNRRALGRHTDKLTSCEDFDIVFTAIDEGFGTGVFRHLKIKHLIPRRRVQRDYLLRLAEGHGYSSVFLHSFRGTATQPSSGLLHRLRRWRYRRTLSHSKREELEALARGETRAHAALRKQKRANG
jgi:glycosyltransferase involved in cell wall biosynthesis